MSDGGSVLSAGRPRRARTDTVLPRPRRVNRPVDFRRVLRRGRRSGRRCLSVHAHLGSGSEPARAGLVVGRGVGGAVIRHRVSRRLRHLLAERLDLLPVGTDVVVRAHPPAADAPSGDLAADLDAALRRLGLGPLGADGQTT